MRLSEIDYQLNDSKEVEITAIDGTSFNPKAFVYVMQENSKEGTNANLHISRKALELFQDKENLDDKGNLKPEFVVSLAVDKLARLTTNWTGIEDDEGNKIEFTLEKCIEIYTKYDHIANTVFQFSHNAKNYLGKSQPTLLPTQNKKVGTPQSPLATKSKSKKSTQGAK